MQSYRMNMGAGLKGLALVRGDVPVPGPREVLLRVRAVSLNYRELMILMDGRYPLPVKPDVVPACDGACEVAATGTGVSGVKVGDRVIVSIFPRWIDGPFSLDRAAQLGGSLDGMLTEYTVVDEEALVPVPEHLSWEEAAALPCAGTTAWNALMGGAAPLRAGEWVLVLGSGGVSLSALQLAKSSGAEVVATTSSDEKAARLKALGADHVVNYASSPDWASEVRRLTRGEGVHRVVEVGGGRTLQGSLKALRVGGEVALVGTVGGGPLNIDAGAIFGTVATVRAVAAGSRAHLAAMARSVAVNRCKPVIDRVFTFQQARQAFEHYAQGRAFGKVVISVTH